METGSCHGGMKAAILRIESNLKETDIFFLTEKAEEKKTCAELQMWWIPSRTPQFIEVWDVDTIQRRDSTICIWDCFYFPALTWIPLFSAQINATSCPPTTPPQNRAHRTVFLSECVIPSPYTSEIATTCLRGPQVQAYTLRSSTIIANLL